MTTAEIARTLQVCVIIPTYNNKGTIVQVVEDVSHYCDNIFVVCDGPTDGTKERIEQYANNPAQQPEGSKFQVSGIRVQGAGCRNQVLTAKSPKLKAEKVKVNCQGQSQGHIRVIAYTPNKGKGTALTTGFREAQKEGFRYAITLDSDGQHYASDIPAFLESICQNEDTLLIGSRGLKHDNMPQKNTFANKFSNFWFTVQTAHKLPDTQTGFRLYPLQKMGDMRLMTSRYEAELELLVRSAWRNIPIVPLPIKVYYPPAEERVSHFRPAKDFTRISILNTFFCFAAIFYGYPSMILRKLFGKKL